MGSPDPYATLGVAPTATEEELRTAYRRLVQLHHPDHNNGSRESTLRFAEVQEAYAHVKLLRKQATTSGSTRATAGADPGVDARLQAMEHELRHAREQREKAARAAAQEAARAYHAQQAEQAQQSEQQQKTEEQRAADEELGYYSTNDSFAKILDDFADQVSTRFAEAHPPPNAADRTSGEPKRPRTSRSLADWIDELGSKLTGEPRSKDEN